MKETTVAVHVLVLVYIVEYSEYVGRDPLIKDQSLSIEYRITSESEYLQY